MSSINLSTPTSQLFMIGSTYAKRLEKLDIKTVEDLLHHYPFRYEDYRLVSKISRLQRGETATLQGQIISFENIYTKWGKKLQKMIVADETGQIQVIFFNQPFLKQSLKPGLPISLSGKIDIFSNRLSLISPEYELIKKETPYNKVYANVNFKNVVNPLKKKCTSTSILRSIEVNEFSHRILKTIHTGRLVPIYPETYGVSSKWLRSRIAPILSKLLPKLPDWLPESIKKYNALIDLRQALVKIHFPQNKEQIGQARARLAFDELFLIQLQTLIRKHTWQKSKTSQPLKVDQKKIDDFIYRLPFKLTADQQKVIKEILKDLTKAHPMNRLLQGDVGCGKTVVAAIAAYVAFLNGTQTAFMAPTEILAFQHHQTLKTLLESFGVKVGLVTGSKRTLDSKTKSLKAQRRTESTEISVPSAKFSCAPYPTWYRGALSDQKIYPNSWDILIGTHALLYDKVAFQRLGLVVIDEQHRFGVEQRATLIKKGKAPHILIMTATPIPRTVALTLYGDLDLSIIKEMPKGRQKTKTWVVPPEKRAAAYSWIRKQIQQGRDGPSKGSVPLQERNQVFIVCPLIEPSQAESMQNIKAVKQEFEKLSKEIFPDLRLGLLHGRLKGKEKEKIINDFRNKKLDILVATPVVEVGLDIPDATIILIEAAERFGLATLHQLRGRVGRSDKQAFCLLFSSEKGKAYKRLKLMETHDSGRQLAEKDLRLRGPGELYGTAQHGFLKLKIASFSDAEAIEKTRRAAGYLLQKTNYQLRSFPLLKEKLKSYTIKNIEPN